MSKEINHWCVICGKGYHACDSCDSMKSFTPWRALTDTIEHFQLFVILKNYNNKLISKEEARKDLSKINISDKDSYKESVKKVLNEILKDNAVDNRNSKRKSNKAVVNENIENIDKINE